MSKAFGMCAGIAFTAACGLSQEYALPTGGLGAGVNGGNGDSGGIGSTGNTGGSTVSGNGTVGGNSTVGGNGGNGTVGGNGGNGTVGGNGGNGTIGGNGTVGGNGGNGTIGGNGTVGGNGPGGTAGAGTGTGGKGSSSGGAIGTGTGGATNCAAELDACGPQATCCAKLTCKKESAAGGSFCESSCANGGSCAKAETTCDNSTCAFDYCGGNTGNGSYNSTCTNGGQTGTCVPYGGPGNEYGLCSLGGTAEDGCVENAPTTDPADICIAGWYCGPGRNGPGDECYLLCPPGFGGDGRQICADAGFNGGCFALNDLGVCF